ncbi:hypothetical protein [Desulfovibrio legallii]|jgi:hypothetical protein|uniref:Uncharacterized protein n=1 Tax=Desulfovibrio legallii TaxID=571438 RepID=A0A1G7HY94_9BACT|nr:hypothetical protein [Desulfovibrio legallii]SDF05216.1 hypothetical protein SAMN05192586_10172 [Desulfovibrio legallii]
MENRFGTTEDMVIQAVEENGASYMLAIDKAGLYLTTPNYVGSVMADRHRYSAERKGVKARLTALGLDPEELWSGNQHRIRSETVATKKVNPLKASKRGSKG